MSEDWNTVDAKRSARDLEILRQRYRNHRDALSRLNGDAPTEQLATEYARLMSEIDRSLEKLNELDRGAASYSDLDATEIHQPRVAAGRPASAGDRVLAPGAAAPTLRDSEPLPRSYDPPVARPTNLPRLLLMAVVGVAVLAVLYFLVTRASSRKGNDRIVENDTVTTSAARTETQAPLVADTAPPPAASPLSAKPSTLDYGIIRKGTRKVLQVEVLNSGTTTIPIAVARSGCKCFFYEYPKDVAPKKKTAITVAVDGARAKVGPLEETIAVTSKSDPGVSTSFTVKATIK
jgi:hypothetical protein